MHPCNFYKCTESGYIWSGLTDIGEVSSMRIVVKILWGVGEELYGTGGKERIYLHLFERKHYAFCVKYVVFFLMDTSQVYEAGTRWVIDTERKCNGNRSQNNQVIKKEKTNFMVFLVMTLCSEVVGYLCRGPVYYDTMLWNGRILTVKWCLLIDNFAARQLSTYLKGHNAIENKLQKVQKLLKGSKSKNLRIQV